MARTTDVAIVGGGVIGCAIAYYLSRLGVRSTVFESQRLAHGASGATAGLVTPLWHTDRPPRAGFALGLRSLELFVALAEEMAGEGIDPGFRRTGVTRVARIPGQVEKLRLDLAWQGELGLGVRWLTADELTERQPGLHPEVRGGVFSPGEGYAEGETLVHALADAASRAGATVLEGTEVAGLEAEGRRVLGVRTAGETYHAGHTVLAAGPWTGVAGRWAPYPIPVRPVKGQRLLLRKAGLTLRGPVLTFGRSLVPQSGGAIIVGGTRHEGEFDQQVTAGGMADLLEDAVSNVPALRDATFLGGRAGVRPGSPDGVPILGPLPTWDGLSIASGHDHAGVMLATGTAELMARYISTGDEAPLAPFSIARFSPE